MILSYAICVCNEHSELDSLLAFLEDVRPKTTTEIVILVDSSKRNDLVESVILKYPAVKRFEREFGGHFAEHKNYLNNKCSGHYIFNIDADEIPQEKLMSAVYDIALKGEASVVYVPRINICPGYTERFLKRWNFNVNEAGWINWPDYQGRLYKKGLFWTGKVHEKIQGTNTEGLQAVPDMALWHIKSVTRQNRQNTLYDIL